MITIPLINLFQFTLFVCCSLLAAFVLRRRQWPSLAALFFAIGLHAGFIALEQVYGVACFDHAIALTLLYSPLMYLSARGFIRRQPGLKRRDWLHFLPYLLAVGYWAVAGLNDALVVLLAVLSQGYYLLRTWRMLSQFDRVVRHTQSNSLFVALGWLQGATRFYLVFCLLMIVRFGMNYWLQPQVVLWFDHLFFIFCSAGFALYVFLGLGSARFIPVINPDDEALADYLQQRRDRLDSGVSAQLIRQLERFMLQRKPYTDPQINLQSFAEQLNLPARQVSELINDQFRMSFSEYVNRARVEEAKRLMQAPGWHNHSLLEIGLAAGFNSKSSFNLMFKRLAGTTPSAFRQTLAETANKPPADPAEVLDLARAR